MKDCRRLHRLKQDWHRVPTLSPGSTEMLQLASGQGTDSDCQVYPPAVEMVTSEW